MKLRLGTKVSLVALLNLALVACVLTIFVRLQLRQEFDSFLMATARERLETVSRLLVLDLQRTEPPGRDALLAEYSSLHGVRFLLVRNDGGLIAGPDTPIPEEVLERLRTPGPQPHPPRPGDRRLPPPFERRGLGPPPPRLPGAPPFLVVARPPLPYWVGVRIPVAGPEGDEPATLLLASASFWTNPFFFQLRPWLALAALAAAVSLVCWLPLVRSVRRSIVEMTRATARIAEGRFDTHVDDGRGDELGQLAQSIDSMAARLEVLVRGQTRFLGDVAHELRSPLARMQVALEILERGDAGRSHLTDLAEDVRHMSNLTDELLALARAELRPGSLELVPTSVAQAAERAVRLEARDGADVRVEVDPRLMVRADPDQLFRALANVVRNAVRHAGTAGPIVVRASRRGERVAISVEDSGPGLPAASLARVFEPFYRVEDSRSGAAGGTGLGLAIVRSCVEACAGSVECRNRKPTGLVVTIQLAAEP